MLMKLLDCTSHTTYFRGFAWCSMKSIGHVLLWHKAALWVATPLRVIIHRVSYAVYQAALQATSSLVSEKLDTSPCTSFPYQTIQGQNIPLEPSRIEIWENNPPNQNNWLGILPSQRNVLTSSFLLSLFETHKSFLHACTPERRTRAFAHLFHQHEHVQAPQTKKHILQKNLQGAETLRNDSSGGASKPHRSKYIGSAQLFCPFYRLWRSHLWKAW